MKKATTVKQSKSFHVDAKETTPLHLACKEPTPLHSYNGFLFVERTAASSQDQNGRLPRHVAILQYKSEQLLDKCIQAHLAQLA